MAYQVPQVRVFQELANAATTITNQRSAHITGGHAKLFRYDEADEKELIGIGAYAAGTELTASWPNRPAGGLVDQNYVQLFADDAYLKYYENLIGTGGLVTPVANYTNRVRDAVTTFADNGEYTKSTSMGDRGAKVGDRVYIRGVDGSDVYELNTRIKAFVGETIAASVEAADSVSTNQAATTAGTSVDALTTLSNAITVTADGSSYNGLGNGVVDETYTVTVTKSSINSDLTTATLRVTSASGLDDQASVVPAGLGGFTPIGTNGLQVEFDLNATASASSAAEDNDIDVNDLVAGMSWRIHVRQTFTPPTATSSGTYTGLQTTTYIVEVTKGGLYADSPEISVSTDDGYDSEGPLAVTAASTTFDVGGYGVLVSFNETGLRKGDKYTIVANAQAEGAYKTIVLTDDLPTEIQDATDLDLKLYIKDDVTVSLYKPDDLPNTNYETEATQIVVDSAVMVVHSEWTVDDVLVPLPMESGDLYVQYRAWLSTYADQVTETASSVTEVEEKLGSVHPDNPLAWGVFLAVSNSGGIPVYFTAVADPDDTDEWLTVPGLLEGVEGIYVVVPLSNEPVVQTAWIAHVNAQSAPSVGNWRYTIVGNGIDLTGSVVSATNSSDELPILATLSDNPNASGTQYTLLSVPANNALFETNGVRAGDTVRYLYGTDGMGNTTYTEFVVDEVISEGSLLLLEGHTVAIPVASKIEIWRTYTASDHATLIQQAAAAYNDRRVVFIGNPTVTGSGYEFEGYYAGAAVAGLRSGALPHRPLTNVTLTGIDGMGTAAARLSETQLNLASEEGAWWIFRDRRGNVYNRHGLTTDTSTLAYREESLVSNYDSISYAVRQVYLPYIGQVTITPELLDELGYVFRNVTDSLIATKYGNLGPQLLEVTEDTLDIRQHPIERDRVIINAEIVIPAPLNYLDIHLQLEI